MRIDCSRRCCAKVEEAQANRCNLRIGGSVDASHGPSDYPRGAESLSSGY